MGYFDLKTCKAKKDLIIDGEINPVLFLLSESHKVIKQELDTVYILVYQDYFRVISMKYKRYLDIPIYTGGEIGHCDVQILPGAYTILLEHYPKIWIEHRFKNVTMSNGRYQKMEAGNDLLCGSALTMLIGAALLVAFAFIFG